MTMSRVVNASKTREFSLGHQPEYQFRHHLLSTTNDFSDWFDEANDSLIDSFPEAIVVKHLVRCNIV